MVARTVHYRSRSGSLVEHTVDGAAQAPVLPEGAEELDPDAYAAAREQLEAANTRYRKRLAAGDTKRQREVFDALTAVGIPAAVARTLSGYRGKGQ